MAAPLVAAGLGIAAGDVWLGVLCWRTRTTLGGLLAMAGLALVAFAVSSGVTSHTSHAALVIALIFLLMGGVVYLLGRFFSRLLDDNAGDGSRDDDA